MRTRTFENIIDCLHAFHIDMIVLPLILNQLLHGHHLLFVAWNSKQTFLIQSMVSQFFNQL